VVAQQDDLAATHQIDTFTRIGAVPHNVSQTVNLGYVMFVDVLQNRKESLVVTVDVADNRLHDASPGAPEPAGG
jgi:hypothetical protein